MREQKTIVDGVEFGTIFQFQRIFGAIASSMQPARMLIAFGMVLVLIASGYLWDSISGVDATTLDQTITNEEVQEQRAIAIAQAATSFGHSAPEESSSWNVRDAQAYLLQAWQDYVYEGDVSEKERIEFNQLYIASRRYTIPSFQLDIGSRRSRECQC